MSPAQKRLSIYYGASPPDVSEAHRSGDELLLTVDSELSVVLSLVDEYSRLNSKKMYQKYCYTDVQVKLTSDQHYKQYETAYTNCLRYSVASLF